ncbi:S-layer family protein [Anaerobacterium chartisolvens]|uniref:S-layer family protein n=1 Tax=Anaerobacterium chartisolvens TaxID=1297424 RepID=A0A369BHH5_9FIRM|nr:S-layer homology domain-containing protein [Anaerobacterium chartisolvens]RCX21003.1 S-layer family protein [Anaerobacterium chartisolvens]
MMLKNREPLINMLVKLMLAFVLLLSSFPAIPVSADTDLNILTLLVDTGPYRIKLQWTDNLNIESSYCIDKKTDSGSFSQVATAYSHSYGSTLQWTDSNVREGHTYTYRIRYYVSSDKSYTIYTNEASASVTSAVKPSSLTVTTVSTSEIDLKWAYPATSSYDTVVERKGAGADWAAIATVSAGTNTYSDSGLMTNTTYYYRIRAYAGSNIYSGAYPGESGRWAVTKVGASGGLYGYASSSNAITLKWDDSSNKTTYFDIQRKTSDGSFITIKTVSPGVSTYTDIGLEQYKKYTYRIGAKASYSGSPDTANYTDEVEVTCFYISPPTGLTVKSALGADMELVWTDNSSNETGFEIWRKAGENGEWQQYGQTERNVNSFTDDDTLSDIMYAYRVRAHMLYNNSYSSFTNEASAWSMSLEAATDLQYTRISDTEIKLVWADNSSRESGFAIERKTGVDGEWVQIASLAANITTHTDKSVQKGKKYFYRIKTFDNIYFKSYIYSEIIEIRDNVTGTPSDLSIEALSSSQVKLTWKDNSNNESGFKIERLNPSSLYYEEIARVDTNVTVYYDSGLTPGTYYYYRIRAFDLSSNTEYTREMNIRTPQHVSIKDVADSHWAFKEIENLVSRDILKTNNGYFKPSDKITRGELASMLVTAFGVEGTSVGSFADVNSRHKYYKQIMVADKMGIITVSKNNYFYPDSYVAREEMAIFVARTLKTTGKPLNGYEDSILDEFSDKDDVSRSALYSVAAMLGEGIMSAQTKNGEQVIAPRGSVTRADAAVVIFKAMNRD